MKNVAKKMQIFVFCTLFLVACSSAHHFFPDIQSKPTDVVFSYDVFEKRINQLEPPTIEQVAEERKISADELTKQVKLFAAVIRSGHKGRHYNELCETDQKICELITDYFAFRTQLQTQNRENRRAARKLRRALRIYPSQVAKAQKENSIDRYLRGLKISNEKKFLELANKAVDAQAQCPQNLSAALSSRAEDFFPNEEVQKLSQTLFQQAEPCLTLEEKSYEALYLKQGLFALFRNDTAKAEEYLKKAQAVPNGRERYRVLYWLGKIANDRKVSAKKNEAWNALLKEFPMSYYAVAAGTTIGKDPLVDVLKNSNPLFDRANVNAKMREQEHWLELLLAIDAEDEGERWAEWINRDLVTMDQAVVHYLAALQFNTGLYRTGIGLLMNYYKEHPDLLNAEAILLLYPRPYYDVVQKYANDEIDHFFVLGLIRQESAFDPGARSQANARGLMQLVPRTARRLATYRKIKLYDAEENTKLGIKYLINLASRYEGEMDLVLAAYNAGAQRVEKWLKHYPDRKDTLLWSDMIPFMETRDYVTSVLRNNYWYSRIYKSTAEQKKNEYTSHEIEKFLSSM